MASLGIGKGTPGAHWKPGGITRQTMGAPFSSGPQVRPRVKPWSDGTYGRNPVFGTPIKTEKEAQDLMDPRTPAGQGLQFWAEGKARQNWEAMIPEFRKRMMRDM